MFACLDSTHAASERALEQYGCITTRDAAELGVSLNALHVLVQDGAPSSELTQLDGLRDLALDLRWSWRAEIRALLRSLDPDRTLTGAADPLR